MSFETPQSLLNAVFYYNGRNFCLRGIREHHNLHFSQIVRLTNPDRYQYIEHGSKNNAGGVDEFKLDVKTVTVTAVKNSAHCHVRILDHYLYHLPNDVSLDGQFYLRPLDCVSKEVWYTWIQQNSRYGEVNVSRGTDRNKIHKPQLTCNRCSKDVRSRSS